MERTNVLAESEQKGTGRAKEPQVSSAEWLVCLQLAGWKHGNKQGASTQGNSGSQAMGHRHTKVKELQ